MIPGHVLFTIDLRHPDDATLRRLGEQAEAVCRDDAGARDVAVKQTPDTPPTVFDGAIRDRIRAAANRQGLSNIDIVSGATDDAKYMADLCPMGIIFVPCEGGLSHNEAENAKSADLAAAARVLAEIMLELANV